MNVSEVQVAPGEAQLLEVRTFPLADVAKVLDVPVAAVDQAQPGGRSVGSQGGG